jgi:hypothetical protein
MPEVTVPPISPQITPEVAKQALQEAEKKITDECSKEIGLILKKYNCDLSVAMILAPNSCQPVVNIVIKK